MAAIQMKPIVTTRSGELPSSVANGALDEFEVKARVWVNGILNRHPAVGLAAGIVRDGRLVFFHGHGLADIASNTPITEDTVFRIASITKTFTAIAVMQLWEQGLLDLNAPANDYMRAYQLISAKASFGPATVRHLLTHTASIPQVLHLSDWLLPVRGENFKIGQAPTLAEYYRNRGGLHVVTAPGASFAYGDHSFATLGQIVEDVSRMPLARYFREHIFAPLGMADTDLPPSERIQARPATGNNRRRNGAEAIADCALAPIGGADRWRRSVAPIAGARSSSQEAARSIGGLLGSISNDPQP